MKCFQLAKPLKSDGKTELISIKSPVFCQRRDMTIFQTYIAFKLSQKCNFSRLLLFKSKKLVTKSIVWILNFPISSIYLPLLKFIRPFGRFFCRGLLLSLNQSISRQRKDWIFEWKVVKPPYRILNVLWKNEHISNYHNAREEFWALIFATNVLFWNQIIFATSFQHF